MRHLDEARRLERSGDLLAALNEVELHAGPTSERLEARGLKASLLERLGRHGQSRALACALLETKSLPAKLRAECEFVLAKIDREDGATEKALNRLQRSVQIAQQVDDLTCFCVSSIYLMLVLSQREGFDAIAPILSRTRSAAIKVGDPQLTAYLHVSVAQMEAKRGLLDNAERHTLLALNLLAAEPNFALSAIIHNTRLGIALLRSDYESAKQISSEAVAAA